MDTSRCRCVDFVGLLLFLNMDPEASWRTYQRSEIQLPPVCEGDFFIWQLQANSNLLDTNLSTYN